MEVRITTSLYGLNELSYIRATIIITKRHYFEKSCKSQKNCFNPDCFLKFECMKTESLVIVNQKVTVNLYLSLVHTARHALRI